ncbi:Sulfotransferase domain - like 4 [Theobroma cacao]|nr:Sulfotransferase domain - like 4 [Theobroma cacao]
MEGEQSHENHPPSSIVEGDDDVIVASKPKAGTIWLKALAFTIVNRTRYSLSNNLLNSAISYNFVPFVEITLYARQQQHPFAGPHPRLLVNLPKRPPPEAKEVFKTKPAPHYKALSITTATGSTVQPPIKGNPTAPKEAKPPAATKTTSEAIPNKRSQPKKQP